MTDTNEKKVSVQEMLHPERFTGILPELWEVIPTSDEAGAHTYTTGAFFI